MIAGITAATVTELIVDASPEPKEYVAVEPSVTLIKQSELTNTEAYVAVEPDATEIKFSITYNDQEPEGLSPEPDITEIQLT